MDNKELKEMRKERYKNDGKRFMKFLIFPLIALMFPALVLVIFFVGDLVLAIMLLAFALFILIPLVNFFVARIVFRNKEKRFWLSLITPLLISLSYLIWFAYEAESYIYAALIFAWCELWSFLGAVRYKKKEKEI